MAIPERTWAGLGSRRGFCDSLAAREGIRPTLPSEEAGAVRACPGIIGRWVFPQLPEAEASSRRLAARAFLLTVTRTMARPGSIVMRWALVAGRKVSVS